MKRPILLIDPPTYPKGTLSLSLFVLAGLLKDDFTVSYFDLNFSADKKRLEKCNIENICFIGLKVSAQNEKLCREISLKLRINFPDTPIVWGGELATLQPEYCEKYADTVVSGMFESIRDAFVNDLKNSQLQKRYIGKNDPDFGIGSPDFTILPNFSRYNQFMGMPLETSRGCTEHCTFCMVLSTQSKHYFTKPIDQLQNELKSYSNRFINIIDYNFGVSQEHVLAVSKLIQQSTALGWMAEMNLELLDNEEVLLALKSSRCRMIYCGLESIHEHALKEVNKQRTNQVAHYENIIRKVQAHGIHVVAGIILGLGSAKRADYLETVMAFKKWGIGYIKLTFLTYNPGSRIHAYHAKKDRIISEELAHYDGQHLTYLEGNSEEEVRAIAKDVISDVQSFRHQLKRISNSKAGWVNKLEMALFSFGYSRVYIQWSKNNIVYDPNSLDVLLGQPYKKPIRYLCLERLIFVLRKLRQLIR